MKRLPLLLLGSYISCTSQALAADLGVKLNKIGLQVDRAEIFAANCVVDAQEKKVINDNCLEANDLLEKMNKRLDYVVQLNTSGVVAVEEVESLRTKINQINAHLTEARITTGNFEWAKPHVAAPIQMAN